MAFEIIFKKFWRTTTATIERQSSTIDCAAINRRWQTLSELVGDAHPITSVAHSQFRVGYDNGVLFLPRFAHWSKDRQINEDLFTMLIVRSMIIADLNLFHNWPAHDAISPRLFVLQNWRRLESRANEAFPGYASLAQRSLSKYVLEVSSKKYAHTHSLLADFWAACITLSSETINSTDIATQLTKKFVRHPLPEFLHATVPLPLLRAPSMDAHSLSPANDLDADRTVLHQHSETRSKFQEKAAAQNERGPENPIHHSFEKIETLDSYTGGSRAASDADELQQHQSALDEVELSTFTSEGGRPSSIYRQDIVHTSLRSSDLRDHTASADFVYDEWSTEKATYLKNHCRVLESVATTNKTYGPTATYDSARNSHDVRKIRTEIERIFYRPSWLYRKKDGSELDVDSFLRDYNSRTGCSNSENIYAQKQRILHSPYISILADQSQSTDSWVNGVRVATTIEKTLTLFKHAFQDLIETVEIAKVSSQTRHCIQYHIIKEFERPWRSICDNDLTIHPTGYTRIGGGIRHAVYRMSKIRRGSKILIILTDGKPVDLDPYEGRHGIEDVKRAVEEARQNRIIVVPIPIGDTNPASIMRMFSRPHSMRDATAIAAEIPKLLRKSMQR